MGEIADYAIDQELAPGPDEASFIGTHIILPRRAHISVVTAKPAAVRLMREACILETLRHPGVPRIYDCGVVANGYPWVAREHVPGSRFGTPLTTRELAVLLRDVAAVLAHAHARGVIHGDVWLDAIVKPETPRDFPLCLINWRHARRGTPADGAGDVYALGLVAVAALPRDPSDRLATLVDDMLATVSSRPTAAEVSAEAGRIADTPTEDDTEIVEVALLVDLSREPPPPPPRERHAG